MSGEAGYSIVTEDLSRDFGSFRAVDRVSFRVREGSVCGMLGANGAGKSTTIRMLCGLLRPTGGRGEVAGFDIATQSERIKRNIGYMSQKFSLYEDLTVRENIRFFGGIYGLDPALLREREGWALEMAGLSGSGDRLVGELSGGWKQRLALGCAVLHRPKVVFLDEPTGGVDPVARRLFWNLISELAAGGMTVLVTTHYLDEAEYCDAIILMHQGKVIADGGPGELKDRMIPGPLLELESDRPEEAMSLLRRQPWVSDCSLFGTRLHVLLAEGESGAGSGEEAGPADRVRRFLQREGFSPGAAERVVPSMEDLFIHLVEGSRSGNGNG